MYKLIVVDDEPLIRKWIFENISWNENGFEFAGESFSSYHILFVISAALFVLPHLLQKNLTLKEDAPAMEVVAFVTRHF